MNTIPSFFFKDWLRCVLTLLVLGAVLITAQQGVSRRHRLAVQSASPSPARETRVLPDPAAEADLPQPEIPVATTPNEPLPVSGAANVVAPVSAPATETVVVSTVPGQPIVPPLAHAVTAASSAASVGLGSSGNNETPTLNPPLAFTVDPKNLSPQQQTALARIQDQFLTAIGDANQNPADPAYGDRWMTAQEIADQAYKAMFGWTAFSQMQLDRAKNSYTAIQVP